MAPIDPDLTVKPNSKQTIYLPDIRDPDEEDKVTFVMKCDPLAAKFVTLKGTTLLNINPGPKDAGNYEIKLILTDDNKYQLSTTYKINLVVEDDESESTSSANSSSFGGVSNQTER